MTPLSCVDYLQAKNYVVQKPKKYKYPNDLRTLSSHILKARLDRELSRKEVVEKLNTSMTALITWERDTSLPAIHLYPTIMDWLGYCPVQYPKTIEDFARLYRTHLLGIGRKQFLKKCSISQYSAESWYDEEKGSLKKAKSKQLIRKIINKLEK